VLPKNDENDEICCRVASGIHRAPTGQTGETMVLTCFNH
jgi:hypothetical protein